MITRRKVLKAIPGAIVAGSALGAGLQLGEVQAVVGFSKGIQGVVSARDNAGGWVISACTAQTINEFRRIGESFMPHATEITVTLDSVKILFKPDKSTGEWIVNRVE